jgi:hypothetical protein
MRAGLRLAWSKDGEDQNIACGISMAGVRVDLVDNAVPVDDKLAITGMIFTWATKIWQAP